MKTLITNVYNRLLALQATGQQLAYVKKLYLGDPQAGVIIEYPAVAIVGTGISTVAQTIGGGPGLGNRGSDETTFTLNIFAAVRNHDGQATYFGNTTTGEKGILDLCDDLRNIFRAETFSGALTRPANIPDISINYIVETGNHIWVARLDVEGRRKEQRPR
jgi:hypothetical protein